VNAYKKKTPWPESARELPTERLPVVSKKKTKKKLPILKRSKLNVNRLKAICN
jgi:hypothetical protein